LKKKSLLLFYTLFLSFLFIKLSNAEIKEEIINKIENTDTLTFEFKQKIDDRIETGDCVIKYPKLLRCDYEDKYRKRLISNGKTLAVIQRKYKKIFYYPLKTTPLYFILDKEYLLNFLSKNDPILIDDILIKFIIKENNNLLEIFFEKNSKNLKGWKTKDIYKKDVEFLIMNLETNMPANKKLFKIPFDGDL